MLQSTTKVSGSKPELANGTDSIPSKAWGGGGGRRKKRVRDSLENIALEFVFNVICTGKNVAAR